jgi:hypothetical protein
LLQYQLLQDRQEGNNTPFQLHLLLFLNHY